MKAVILNSGIGSRMGKETENKPKCLVGLKAEETILSRQLRQLLQAGITDILVTIGPFGNQIPDSVRREFPDLSVLFVRNDRYASTNYIYSMYLADAFLREDLLLMHGDMVMEDRVLTDILETEEENAVIIDSTVPLPEKDFKGRVTGGLVREIGVSLKREEGVFFLLPVYKLSSGFMTGWMDEIASFVDRGDTGVYAENAFNAISGELALSTLDIRGRFCMEVDTLEDLALAREKVS